MNQYIHKWLGIPISWNVNHLRLQVKQLGIGLKLPSDIYRLNQITVWNILGQNMRELFEIPGMKNIRNDSIVKRSANAKIAKSTLGNEIQNDIMTFMNNLKRTKYLNVISSTKSFKNCYKKLEFVDRHSIVFL